MNRILLVALVAICTVLTTNLAAQHQLDPQLRKEIMEERKGMDCAGIYQQTKLKVDAQLKLTNKLDTSAGVSSQTVATMTDVTTALGLHRRELCEFYKHDPEFTKDDYFRAVGELNKGESDAALLFQYASGKASPKELQTLQTVKPQEATNG